MKRESNLILLHTKKNENDNMEFSEEDKHEFFSKLDTIVKDKKKFRLFKTGLITSSILAYGIIFVVLTYILSYAVAPIMSPGIQQWIYDSRILNRSENKSYIQIVKDRRPEPMMDKVGTKFNQFFGSPKWKYAQETRTIQGQEIMANVVEFNGIYTRNDTKINMVVRFVMSGKTITSCAWYANGEELPYANIYEIATQMYGTNLTEEQVGIVSGYTEGVSSTSVSNTTIIPDPSDPNATLLLNYNNMEKININDTNEDIISKLIRMRLNDRFTIDTALDRLISTDRFYSVRKKDYQTGIAYVYVTGKNPNGDSMSIKIKVDTAQNALFVYNVEVGGKYTVLEGEELIEYMGK